MKLPTVDFSGTDYKWHAYCHECVDPKTTGHLSIAVAHTADSVRLTQLLQASVKHCLEVHGAS